MPRIPYITRDEMNEDQRRLFEAITGGKRGDGRGADGFLDARGAMRGPFNVWMQAPNIGQAAQRLGEALRFEGVLSARLREAAILVVAAHYRAQYEWYAHARIAAAAGMEPEVLEAVKAGAAVDSDEHTVIVVDTVRELLAEGRISDARYASAHAALGDEGTVELVAVAGYYVLVSMILNSFEVPLPEGETPPFA